MNDSSISLKKIILAIIKAFIIPLIAIFILKKWNLFLYITFIPEDQRYDVGLTFYVALFEIIISALAEYLETKHAHVKLIFFEVKSNENINNVPTIICNSNYGTASLSCHIILHGDYKLLKKCQIKMDYPSWLTTQISSTDTILSSKNNTLYWNITNLLPEHGSGSQNVEYTAKISFIRNQSDNDLKITLHPELNSTIQSLGVKLSTNAVIIQNKE